MDYRVLGATGLWVSSVCLGAMNFGSRTIDEDATTILNTAIEEGINFVNTADLDYSGRSEQIVGRVIRERGLRSQMIWSTEISGVDLGVPHRPDLTREKIFEACERSLARFGSDYIDLYNIPRPSPHVPIEETLSALTDLVNQGKVRHIGTSTFPAWMVLEAQYAAEKNGFVTITSEQPPYNLLDRRIENELVPLCIKHNISIIPWAPLAQGVLAGRYQDAVNPPPDSRAATIGRIYRERVTQEGVNLGHKLTELATDSGKTAAQFALLWIRDQPGVTSPIVGVRTIAHLHEILACLDLALTPDERDACDRLNPPGSVITSFFNTAPWMKMRV